MVRGGKPEELDAILAIYAAARRFMAEHGNPTQWGKSYPPRDMVEEDLRLGRLYVVCDQAGVPHGAFVYLAEPDPSYTTIDGAWLNDRPYGTIHRVASDGAVKGVLAQAVDHCAAICPNLRADTHKNNLPMQHLLEKYGFQRCGTINLDQRDGDTLRIAYQREG